MGDLLTTLAFAMAIILGAALGMASTYRAVTDSCQKGGAFRIGDKVFVCKPKAPEVEVKRNG